MSDVADQGSGQLRVCPRCGTEAGTTDRCAGCGLHIAALTELPTRTQWLARNAAGVTGAQPVAAAAQARQGAAAQGVTAQGATVRAGQDAAADGHGATLAAGLQIGAPAGATPHTAASIGPLLHPTEPSRLVLALVASALALAVPVLILVQIPGGVGTILFGLAFVIGSIWLATQMRRARLLGQSVRVDAGTFPELQAIVEEVCATLQYHRRLEVYVTETAKPSIVTTSLLGTRIILIEGSLLADLLEPGKRSQLTFLVGRSVGALRAKHMRLDLVVLVMQAADVLKYVTPFILPYYRATAYSGDQIGMMCCSDLDAALEATRRLLVGGEMASQLTSGAVLPQALLVKRRLLPRLVQLLAAEPHVTNRYANLLCFGRYYDPDLWTQLRMSMNDREIQCLDGIWQRSPYRWRVDAAGRLL